MHYVHIIIKEKIKMKTLVPVSFPYSNNRDMGCGVQVWGHNLVRIEIRLNIC
jgi:hypothetical protein